MSEQKMHTHKRRVGKGAGALKQRRTIALITLEGVAEPNQRQQAEIETLRKRVGRG
jgi:hypothetical protein